MLFKTREAGGLVRIKAIARGGSYVAWGVKRLFFSLSLFSSSSCSVWWTFFFSFFSFECGGLLLFPDSFLPPALHDRSERGRVADRDDLMIFFKTRSH